MDEKIIIENGIISGEITSPLPDKSVLALSKSKVFAVHDFILVKLVQFYLDSAENIVGKREMLITSIFFFSAQVFKRLPFLIVTESGHCAVTG